jgi:hypothetical protein
MTLFMPDTHHRTVDGLSQHRSPLPPGHHHTTDVVDGQKLAMLIVARAPRRPRHRDQHVVQRVLRWSKNDFLCIHPLVNMTLERRPRRLQPHLPRPRLLRLQGAIIDIGYSSVSTPVIACPHRHDATTMEE